MASTNSKTLQVSCHGSCVFMSDHHPSISEGLTLFLTCSGEEAEAQRSGPSALSWDLKQSLPGGHIRQPGSPTSIRAHLSISERPDERRLKCPRRHSWRPGQGPRACCKYETPWVILMARLEHRHSQPVDPGADFVLSQVERSPLYSAAEGIRYKVQTCAPIPPGPASLCLVGSYTGH